MSHSHPISTPFPDRQQTFSGSPLNPQSMHYGTIPPATPPSLSSSYTFDTYSHPKLSPKHAMTSFNPSIMSGSRSPGLFHHQTSNPGSPAFGFSASIPSSPYSESYNIQSHRPPISVLTSGHDSSSSPLYDDQQHDSFPLQFTGSAPLSASSLAYFTASAGLDPTSVIYDENSRGYATPSYAGSYADESSFDGYRSNSPFSLPGSFMPSPDFRSDHDINPPILASSHDLLTFREQNKRPNEWDELSSITGGNEDTRSSTPSVLNNLDSSPSLLHDRPLDGNGLEMAVERMFAPLPSPQLRPIGDQALRATSAPPIHLGDSAGQPNLSSSHSPRFNGGNHVDPPVPHLARLSPSPKSTSIFPQNIQQNSIQPSLKSPPLPYGIQQSESKMSQLAPLAIPMAPDLTLTTATPTAMPRTATTRLDSTQAALDTVFSTFFEKKADRKVRSVFPSKLSLECPVLILRIWYELKGFYG